MIFNIFWWKSSAIYDHRNLWEQSPWNRQQSFGIPQKKTGEIGDCCETRETTDSSNDSDNR